MREGLVPEEARRLIGATVGPGEPLEIRASDVERFCKAIGDDNPLFFDPAAAAASVYGARPMPLAYPLTQFASGTERDFQIPLRAPRRLRGEDELVVGKPVKVGDTLRARTRLVAIEEKAGRSGPMVFLRYETEYLDQEDEVAMVVRTTIIRR